MIYVFKTSVKYKIQIKNLSNKINEIDGIIAWNFDLEDCDNILRIDSKIKVVKIVCKTMQSLGYTCIELQ